MINLSTTIHWIFGIIFLVVGVLNLILIHAVPGMVYLMLSFLYLPPSNAWIGKRIPFTVPLAVKIIFGLVILWWTLGMSDLGDRYL